MSIMEVGRRIRIRPWIAKICVQKYLIVFSSLSETASMKVVAAVVAVDAVAVVAVVVADLQQLGPVS